MSNNKVRSEKIRNLSFLLALMVVWLHSAPGGELPFMFKLTSLTNHFCTCAVPTFFFISGFLFFHNYQVGKASQKLFRRVRGLLIPYLLWNFIASICWFLIAEMVGTEYVEPCSRYYGFQNYLSLFLTSGHLSVFWFVRNLIVYAVLSPILYFTIRNKFVGGVAVFCAIIPTLATEMAYTSIVYWAQFYILGGWVGIHYKKFFSIFPLQSVWKQVCIVALWLCCFFCAIVFQHHLSITLFRLFSVFGIVVIYDLLQIKQIMKSRCYYDYAFGLYATHYIPLYVVQVYHSLHTQTLLTNCLVFYLVPVLIVMLSLVFCNRLELYLPHLYSLLMGRRSSSSQM